jgi:predicted kinase
MAVSAIINDVHGARTVSRPLGSCGSHEDRSATCLFTAVSCTVLYRPGDPSPVDHGRRGLGGCEVAVVGHDGLVAEVLALHGSPGAGKSTVAQALALTLGHAHIPWGVIDMDELSLIHPYPGRSFARENLRVIWPKYVAAVPDIKLIIPTVFADEQEVELLRAVLPGARLIICELTAPVKVLKQRVAEREPTEEMALDLRRWVDVYHARSDHERIRHFQVATYPTTVDESVHTILQLANWL